MSTKKVGLKGNAGSLYFDKNRGGRPGGWSPFHMEGGEDMSLIVGGEQVDAELAA